MTRWMAAVAAGALLLTACGGEEGKGDCIALDAAVSQAVADGADGQLTVGQGQAVRVESGVYYAAFHISVAGADEVGVWALDGLPPQGIRSVDGYAQQFTTWPTLEGANASDGVRAATDCLG